MRERGGGFEGDRPEAFGLPPHRQMIIDIIHIEMIANETIFHC